jgi:superfamily II DNA helicase RecQ
MPAKDFERLEIHYKRLKKSKEERVHSIVSLIKSRSCRNQELLKYFGEDMTDSCGHCDNCQPSITIDVDKVSILSAPELELLIKQAKKINDTTTLTLLQKMHSEGIIQIPASFFSDR